MNWLNDATEEVQIEAVRKNGYDIYYIKNPSKNVQLEAVRRSPFSVRYIKNPCSKVQEFLMFRST